MLNILYMFGWELPKKFYVIMLRPSEKLQIDDVARYVAVVLLTSIVWKLLGPIGVIFVVWAFPYLFAVAIFLWAYVFFDTLPSDL